MKKINSKSMLSKCILLAAGLHGMQMLSGQSFPSTSSTAVSAFRLGNNGSNDGFMKISQPYYSNPSSQSTVYELGLYTYTDAIPVRIGGNLVEFLKENGGTNNVFMSGKLGIGVSGPSSYLSIKINSNFSSTDPMDVKDASNNTQFILKNNGNLGIGVASPSYKLDVSGTTHLSGNAIIDASTVAINALSLFQSPSGTTSGQYPLLVNDNTAASLFGVTNGGDVYINKLANGSNRMLYLDGSGKVYGDNVVSPTNTNTWFIGGNTATTYGDRVFGFTDNANIQVKVNNFEAFKVYGQSQTGSNPWYNTGFVEFRRNVAMGGSNSSPLHCDGNTLLSLKQGQFDRPVGGLATHQALFVGYDINDNERFRYQPSGFTSIGTDNYVLSGTNYSTGLFYDPDKEHLYLDQQQRLILGYDYSGYQPKYSGGGFSLYGLIINNSLPNVINQVAIGTGTQITDQGSFMTGTLDMIGDIMPDQDVTYDLGSYSQSWNAIWQQNAIVISDGRLKENVTDISSGLDAIMKLRPVSYKFKKSKLTLDHFGFIAQEVKKLFPNSIVAGKETDSTHLGIIYDEFVPLLTKAVQEQQATIEALTKKVELLTSVNKTTVNPGTSNKQVETINQSAVLFQNHPNPFNGVTFIDYFLPSNSTNAFVRVTDENGRLVQAFPINQTGYGQVELNCQNLAAGNYFYSLIVNSVVIDSKPMVITSKN